YALRTHFILLIASIMLFTASLAHAAERRDVPPITDTADGRCSTTVRASLWGSAGYDPVRDRMLFFGGIVSNYPDPTTSSNEVWALYLGGDPYWARLEPLGIKPSRRYGQ